LFEKDELVSIVYLLMLKEKLDISFAVKYLINPEIVY
jgi:hypothetical protein